MTDDLPGPHGILATATNGNPELVVTDEILVGNTGFRHTEYGYILKTRMDVGGTVSLEMAWMLYKFKLDDDGNP
ncbi:MAG: hypothetical protein ACRDRT_01810 [Pseudonocardiaceae bacterium]